MAHNIKSIRAQFKAKGVFYSDQRMAELLKSLIPSDVDEVYDPTCGDGGLLAVFPDEVRKYGQELDPVQAREASGRLVNAEIASGDTLKEPAFIGKRLLRKNRTEDYLFMLDNAPDIERKVPLEEIAENGFSLNVGHYVLPPEPERPQVNPLELENKARQSALKRIRAEINFSLMVAKMEGSSIELSWRPMKCEEIPITRRG